MRGHKVGKNKVHNFRFQLAILIKVLPFVASFVAFGSQEFRIDPPSLPEDLEKILWFSGLSFDLLSLNHPNVKIAGGGNFLQFLQVVLSLIKSQLACLDVFGD
jgi:hypothetical protein